MIDQIANSYFDCGENSEILFEDNEFTNEHKLLKREDVFSIFDKNYYLFFSIKEERKESKMMDMLFLNFGYNNFNNFRWNTTCFYNYNSWNWL